MSKCSYCGRALREDEQGRTDVFIYPGKNGGMRVFLIPVCARCAFKAENSPRFRRKLAEKNERRIIESGGLEGCVSIQSAEGKWLAEAFGLHSRDGR